MADGFIPAKHHSTLKKGGTYYLPMTLKDPDRTAWTGTDTNGANGSFRLRFAYSAGGTEVLDADSYVTAPAANQIVVEIPASAFATLQHPSTLFGTVIWTPDTTASPNLPREVCRIQLKLLPAT